MKEFLAVFDPLIKFLKPPRFNSWQTLILASFFTWIVAFFIRTPLQTLFIALGWGFFIAGLGWLSTEKPLWVNGISLSSWLVGAIVCLVIFGSYSTQIPPIAIVLWPTISGVIALLPEFIKAGPKFEIPPPTSRQKVTILILSHILISCWLQFYFIINLWLQEYPSILINNINQSDFAIKIDQQSTLNSQGILVLNLAETRLTSELDRKPWPGVETWLLNAPEKVTALEKEVMQELPDLKEDTFWNFAATVTSIAPGYNLQLLASWRGPSSYPAGYFLKKSCQILPTQRVIIPPSGSPSQSKTATTSVALPSALSQFKCGPVSQPISGQPEFK